MTNQLSIKQTKDMLKVAKVKRGVLIKIVECVCGNEYDIKQDDRCENCSMKDNFID